MISYKSNDPLTRAQQLTMTKPPAIIPHVEMTAGNRRLTIELWKHAQLALNNDKDLLEVAERFAKMHKSKTDEIQWICRHFAHLMGINYPIFSDEFWKEHLFVVNEVYKERLEPVI